LGCGPSQSKSVAPVLSYGVQEAVCGPLPPPATAYRRPRPPTASPSSPPVIDTFNHINIHWQLESWIWHPTPVIHNFYGVFINVGVHYERPRHSSALYPSPPLSSPLTSPSHTTM
ncbi:hypothetical protein OTU49_007115, partial [Cherax quadricarinatus]